MALFSPLIAQEPAGIIAVNPSQVALPGASITLQARVLSATGVPVVSRLVTFTALGFGSFINPSVLTDTNGVATANYLAPAFTGIFYAQATVSGYALTATFSIAVMTTTSTLASLTPVIGSQTVAPGASVLLQARALSSSGLPVVTQLVTFTAPLGGSIANPTVYTDASGVASAIYMAPATAGTYYVYATAGGLTATFSIMVSTSGTPPTGVGMQIRSGNGQVVSFLSPSTPRPLTVVVRNSAGARVPGVYVTWQVTSGVAALLQSTSITDSNGEAGVLAVGNTAVVLGIPYQQATITAYSSYGTANFILTSLGLTTNQQPIGVSAQVLSPTADTPLVGRAGQTLPNAIQVLVHTSTGIPIPNVGVDVLGNQDPTVGPVATCANANVLTDAAGFAKCDLLFGGKPGVGALTVNVGSVLIRNFTYTVTVGDAFAQAYQCTANAGVPARVRGEGRTELVGDLILNCSGNLPSLNLTANIQIFLSTNITSRLLETTNNSTEALLTLNEPSPALQIPNTIPAPGAGQYPNVFRGVKAGDNSLLWLSVPLGLPLPGGTIRTVQVQTIRITNVRANAAQAFSAGQTFIPQQITMFVTLTSSTSIPINNPTQVVGAVLKGLDFTARNCADDDSISTGYAQCSPVNSDLYGNPLKTDETLHGLLKYSEGFDAAFKKQIVAGQDGAPLGTLNPDSESGYVNTVKLGSSTGVANTGTRLIAKFAGIPAGVKIFVTVGPHPKSTSSSMNAVLVSVTDPTGTAGAAGFPLTGTGTTKCADGDTSARSILEVPMFGGAGAATWEITASSSSAVETITFGVAIAYSSNPSQNLPALTLGTAGTVAGNFAPISSDDKMSAISPIPRFADLPISRNLINVDPCVTNLLFTFVTARAGFDTGIAISNTTLDDSLDAFGSAAGGVNNQPYNSRATNGACKLYYFGDKEDGTSLAKPIQNSSVIAAGKQLVYTVFGGGGGIDATPGFQGYIIATCNFHLAHGFAFISDLGAQKLAMGYLALVIPRNNTSRREPADNVSRDSGYNQ